MDLFDQTAQQDLSGAPLADRMRPQRIDAVAGQEHLLAPGKSLRQAIEGDRVPSMIFWGPPGVGKTTLARLVAHYTGSEFKAYSAVTSGVKELREVIAEAENRRKYHNRRTILFIDEIHRFNKSQQDAFLPFVEHGVITLIGATTENPSFELNPALLSRCRVFVLRSLEAGHLHGILERALTDETLGLGALRVTAAPGALEFLSEQAFGDARAALNALETAAALAQARHETSITPEIAAEAMQQKLLRYDRAGEEHYNIISALHKSVRGSDPDAALYWLGRMLESGEDPHFLIRRMARMAVEDIGLADPEALVQAVAAQRAFDFVGLPEGKLILAQLAVYLSLAPKSNAVYLGFSQAEEAARTLGDLPVPLHIRNAPTSLMKGLGYGKGYQYAHDFEGHWVPEEYLPEALAGKQFYVPGELGREKAWKSMLEDRRRLRAEKQAAPGNVKKMHQE